MGIALVLTGLAGCVVEQGDEDEAHAPDRLTRTMVVDLDADLEFETPRDLQDVLATTFTYTHDGDPVDPSMVTVHHVDAEGLPETTSLDAFTGQAVVEDGDRIEIGGLYPVTTLKLTLGTETLAERAEVQAPWTDVGGYPAPLAVSPGALARWTQTIETSFEFTLADLDVGAVAPESGFEEGEAMLERFHERLAIPVENTLRIQAQEDGSEIEVAFQSDGDPSFVGEVLGYDPEQEIDAAAELDAEWEVAFDASLFVGPTGVLERAGSSASAWLDGVGRYRMGPDGDWQPVPGTEERPWFDHEEPYTEEPLDTQPPEEIPDPLAADLAQRFWSLDLAVGDEFRFNAEFLDASGTLHIQAVTQVLAREDKALPGGPTVDAFRLHQRVDMDLPEPSAACTGDESRSNEFWVSATSFLSVLADANHHRSMDGPQLASCLEAVQEMDPASSAYEAELANATDALRSAELEFVLTSKSLTVLQEEQEGLVLAPVLLLIGSASAGISNAAFMQGMAAGFEDAFGDPYEEYSYETHDHELEPAHLRTTGFDADGNGASDWIRLTLVRGENAPYAPANVSLLLTHPEGVTTSHDFESAADSVLCISPNEDAVHADRCDSGGSAFGAAPDHAWGTGESLYVPCGASGIHELVVSIRGTLILDEWMACDEDATDGVS